MPSYVWISVVALVAIVGAGAIGMAYYAAFPELRDASSAIRVAEASPGKEAQPRGSWSAIVRASKPEERRVLEVLHSHGGSWLQKSIVREAGLSKLKTHRIISRFAERGLVTVAKSGNTNEVSLVSWLREDSARP